MPSHADLSLQERLALITGLNGLPDPSFKMLVFALRPPAGILPSDLAAQGDRAFTLLQWVETTGPGLGVLQTVLAQILGKPLIDRTTRLAATDWATLFGYFSPYDFAAMQMAFLKAFQDVYAKGFWQVRPDNPPLNGPDQIQSLLTTFDEPVLAVRFVERVMAALRSAEEGAPRDFTQFEQWRDRIAQAFNVPLAAPPKPDTLSHAYLLVAIEEHGADVNVYPELRVAEAGKAAGRAIHFGARPTTCPVADAAQQISDWIRQAENTPEVNACDDGEIILEMFLPCKYLDKDIASTWRLTNQRGEKLPLGTYRRFLVRSLERIRSPQIQQALGRRWQQLEASVNAMDAGPTFHRQENCPQGKGILCALLRDGDALGLKFVAQLPKDPRQRIDLLNDIIDAAIPIALWSSEGDSLDATALEIEFDILLTAAHLTNFADLAKQWRRRRLSTASAQPIKLLCDRPDRLPQLPDPNREEDLLVAL
jgi:hypothetical protein